VLRQEGFGRAREGDERARIARQFAVEFRAADVHAEDGRVCPGAHRQFVGDLVGVVDAALREVEDIDAERTVAGDTDLSDRAETIDRAGRAKLERILDGHAGRGDVDNRACVRAELRIGDAAREGEIFEQRGVQKERRIGHERVGRGESLVALFIEDQTRAPVGKTQLIENGE
jgi:hypothetical protein